MTGQPYTEERFLAERRQAEEQAAKERQERQEATDKASLRHAWLNDGGSESDFEKEWPKLRDETRRARVVAREQEALSRRFRSGI